MIHHYRTGINTGSQGKGYTEEQAAISAIMEAAETYCADTRNPQFVRGSYATLAKSHIVAPPQAFIPWDYQSQVSDSDVFMWSPCWHFQSKTVALVPSEVIYTFHIPEIFGDVARFPASSAGVAAGFDLQKCLFKSVTEIIEQHYRAEMEALRIKVDWIKPEGFVKEVIARTSREFQQRAETHFFLIRLEGQRYNLPFVICLMGSEFKMHTGWGLNPSLKAAIESAHLEAFQSWATLVSGVRENIVRKLTDVPARLPQNEQDRFNEIWPDEPTLSYSAAENLCTKNWNRDHSVESLIQFLESIGYPSVYLANLSRAGIPCFVTKAIVPNLTLSLRIHLAPTPNVASNWSWAKIASFQYNYIHRRKSR
ncbi:MAG: YcaO-like family protein [Bdellovibrionales bacterium]|nr:YcaO-like family protein [Bdellovibrionales bacterium]